MTLEPGDVILTGTPAGSRPVEPGDEVEVELEGIGRVRNTRRRGRRAAGPATARMPQVTAAVRAAALGDERAAAGHALRRGAPGAAQGLDRDAHGAAAPARDRATRSWRGLRPTRPDLRLLGYAHTLRYVPLREDVRDARHGRAERAEARGRDDRPERGARDRGARRGRRRARSATSSPPARSRAAPPASSPTAALRDSPAVARARHPDLLPGAARRRARAACTTRSRSTCRSPAAGTLVDARRRDRRRRRGRARAPAALAEEVARDALEQEQREAWALERVKAGESIRGRLPAVAERRAEYERWRTTATRGAAPMSNFAADPASIRGAITPLVTPFAADGALDLDSDRAAGRLAARAGHARHLGRRLDRRADLA